MSEDKEQVPPDPTQFYSEFLRRRTPVIIYGVVILGTVLFFALDLPTELLFLGGLVAMIAMGVAYARFARSKGITASRSDEGTVYQMGNQRWIEPRAYFLRVAIFIVGSMIAILAILLITGDTRTAGFLIPVVAVVWALLIRRGIRRQ